MNIKSFLEKHEIKGKDFAEALEISEEHLSRIIHKKRKPSRDLIARILQLTKHELKFEDLVE